MPFLAEKVWIYLKRRSMAHSLDNNERNETKSATMENFA